MRILLIGATGTLGRDAYGEYFPGHKPVATTEAARAYVKSVHGRQTGQVYRVGY